MNTTPHIDISKIFVNQTHHHYEYTFYKTLMAAYEKIQLQIYFEPICQKTMDKIRYELQKELSYFDKTFYIICDYSNNPPNVINKNVLIARIFYNENNENKFLDLVFGRCFNFRYSFKYRKIKSFNLDTIILR